MLNKIVRILLRYERLRQVVINQMMDECDFTNVTISDAKNFHISDCYIGNLTIIKSDGVNVHHNEIKCCSVNKKKI